MVIETKIEDVQNVVPLMMGMYQTTMRRKDVMVMTMIKILVDKIKNLVKGMIVVLAMKNVAVAVEKTIVVVVKKTITEVQIVVRKKIVRMIAVKMIVVSLLQKKALVRRLQKKALNLLRFLIISMVLFVPMTTNAIMRLVLQNNQKL